MELKKPAANKKYNAYRSFIFIENDLVNLKIPDTKTLIEHNAARIIFKPLAAIKKNLGRILEKQSSANFFWSTAANKRYN